MTDGNVYERTVEDGAVEVPTKEAAKIACVIKGGVVIDYIQTHRDGRIPLPNGELYNGDEVQVVIPSDEQIEADDER